MNKYILCLLLCCSCSTTQTRVNDVQSVVDYKRYTEHTNAKWTRILNIAYSSSDIRHVKSMVCCAFCDINGVIHIYDGKNEIKVEGTGNNPVEIADQLVGGVIFAWYENN